MPFIYFCFYFHHSRKWIQKKILLQFMTKSVLPIFSSKNFIVSGFTFRSLTHFEFIFVYRVRECSSFILLHAGFPSTTFWEHCLFSILYSCLSCHRLIDQKCTGLFLSYVICCIELWIWFCASTIQFWLP